MRLSALLKKALSYELTHKTARRGGKIYRNYIDNLSVRCFGAELEYFLSLEIENITDNSKESGKNSIFVAQKGVRFSGADFISEACRLGTLVFVSEDADIKPEIKLGILIIADSARKFKAQMLKALYLPEKPKMKIIGVTGTKGKSTVVCIITEILKRLGEKSFFVGTLGICGIDFEAPCTIDNTTPDATVLYPLLARAEREGYSVAVIEVSSQALKQYRVYGIPFDIVIFTSLGNDHIGEHEHPDFADYLAAKRSLFSSYGAECAIVNYDDAYSAFFSSDTERVIRCGLTRHSDYLIEDISVDFSGTSFLLCGERAYVALPGVYNAVNLTLAIAAVREITSIALAELIPLCKDIRVAGRFELYTVGGRYFIIDYAHNAKSLSELIGTVRKLLTGRVLTLFGAVGGRSYARRDELAQAAEKFADFSIITEDNPNFEDPYNVMNSIYRAFSDKTRAKLVASRTEAIKYAFSVSERGDAILLLGKGHENFIMCRGKKIPFSEKDIIKSVIKG